MIKMMVYVAFSLHKHAILIHRQKRKKKKVKGVFNNIFKSKFSSIIKRYL